MDAAYEAEMVDDRCAGCGHDLEFHMDDDGAVAECGHTDDDSWECRCADYTAKKRRAVDAQPSDPTGGTR